MMGLVQSRKALAADRAGDDGGAATAREAAYEHYRHATRLDPDSPGLQHSAGLMATVAGETGAGLRHFRAAERLDPLNPQHPLYAAQLCITSGAYDEAVEHLNRVRLLDPDEPTAPASLAVVALARDDHAAALEAIADARAIAPHDLGFRTLEAKIHRRAGNADRALELLVPLAPRDRADEGVTIELATLYETRADHAAVARVWENRFEHAPRDARSYRSAVNAGAAHHRAGDRVAAERWLREARVLAPNAAEVRSLEATLAE
jgi:tetratricopeptide (TPR) repeat protein